MRLPILGRFFSRPSRLDSYLLLRLTPSSTQAVIFRPPRELEERPHILGHGERTTGAIQFRGYQLLDFDAVLQDAHLVVDQASLMANLKPRNTILLLPPGLIKAIGLAVRFSRRQVESKMSPAELEQVLGRIQERTIEKAKEQLAELTFRPESHHLISLVVTQYLLDGRRVINPIGLTGQVLELAILFNFAAAQDVQAYEAILSELGLRTQLTLCGSCALAYTLSQEHESGILLEASGGFTSFVFFRQGKINQSDTMNLGQEAWGESFADWVTAVKLKLESWREAYRDLPRQIFVVVGRRDGEAQPRQALSEWELQFLSAEDVQTRLPNVYTLL